MEYAPHGTGGPVLVKPVDPADLRDVSIADTRDYRRALGSFATGITIVTARAPDGRIAGVTANSFCSVSLNPPLVLWCLGGGAPSRAVFALATHFAVHVLAENQAVLSDRFCRPSRNKFADIEVTEGLGGAPLLDGVVALFECRREQRHDAGDHVILVGRVERYRHTDRPPLLFHASSYRGLTIP